LTSLSSPLDRGFRRPAGRAELARRLLLGPDTDAPWVRPALLAILVLTAALYSWGLNRNGLGNDYYAAAVQAGTQSWKAFFFGSLDAGNFITVDKPPVALWVMALSARLFGLNSWSLLLPEAIAGVAAVALLFDAVRRSFGAVAGIVAAVVIALTPVAVVMFRFNNPDALLTLLLVASGWALVRAQAGGRMRWLLLSAALLGLAFNTKYLQAYVALPALVIAYFVAGPGGLGRRVGQLLGAAAVLLVSSGWWLIIVDAIPVAARPFIGGSTNNSVLQLVLGYDGFGRILGSQRPGGGGGVAGSGGFGFFGGSSGGFGGQPGLLRLFNTQVGGEISWLLPLAAAGLLAGLWARRGAPRTDVARAGYILWGVWLVVHAVVFSFASGIFHAYYTVAMAPAVAALAGGGLAALWRLRSRSLLGALALGGALLITAWWGSRLLARTPSFLPGLGTLELVAAAVAAVALLALSWRALPRSRLAGRLAVAAVAVGTAAVMLGPAAYAVDTVAQGRSGPDPSAGPAVSGGGRGGPGGPGGGFAGTGAPGRTSFRGAGGPPPGAFAGGRAPGGFAGQAGRSGPGFGGGSVDSALINYLEQHQGSATWLVAVGSANESASIQLASGRPVMAMGGFSGNDPALTAAQLEALVSSGKLRYVLLGGRGGGGGFGPGGQGSAGANGSQARDSWVTQSCAQVSYAGSSSSGSGSGLYDCSTAAGGA
jgi:4-amino-4-deoxy-L-arabinose transferase-like glycosyltransferase